MLCLLPPFTALLGFMWSSCAYYCNQLVNPRRRHHGSSVNSEQSVLAVDVLEAGKMLERKDLRAFDRRRVTGRSCGGFPVNRRLKS